jgi:hypothetical protein
MEVSTLKSINHLKKIQISFKLSKDQMRILKTLLRLIYHLSHLLLLHPCKETSHFLHWTMVKRGRRIQTVKSKNRISWFSMKYLSNHELNSWTKLCINIRFSSKFKRTKCVSREEACHHFIRVKALFHRFLPLLPYQDRVGQEPSQETIVTKMISSKWNSC